MKIAVWHNLPSGGAKRALYDQIRSLVARGHTVEAWCPPSADRNYLPLGSIVPEHTIAMPIQAQLESTPRTLQMLNPLRWSVRSRLRAMRRHCMECARQIHAKEFDILFAAGCMFFHTPMIGRFIEIPSVVYLQEPNRRFYEASPDLPWIATSWELGNLFDRRFLQRALVRRLKLPGIRLRAREERINAGAFDQILVNSFFSRESVLRAFGLDSKVCYLGVDIERFVNQHKTREDFAVSLAALFPNKNLEFLIQALAQVPAIRRPKLVLIANMVYQPYLEKLQELAERLGVHFELKHRIEDAEVIDLLNQARMMLYAPRLEPFGYAPLEANACGLPVIAVAEGGVRETVQDEINGLLVEQEPRSMANAIERLMLDERLHQRLSEAAYNLARTKWALSSSVDGLERRLMDTLSVPASEPLTARPITTADASARSL